MGRRGAAPITCALRSPARRLRVAPRQAWGESRPHPRGACWAAWPCLLDKTTTSGRRMSGTMRAGWGHHAAGARSRAETSVCLLSNRVKWDGGLTGERKQNPNQQLSNNCFLQYVQSLASRASRYSGPSAPGATRTHTHDRARWPPRSPSRAAGTRARAARLLRGRGRAPAHEEPLRGWGSRGPESPCPRVRGAASPRAWHPEPRHSPAASGRAQACLLLAGLCPAARGSRLRSRRRMRRGATALPPHHHQQDVGFGEHLSGVGGGGSEESPGVCRVTAQKPTRKPWTRASGRSGPCKALGRSPQPR